MWINSWNINIFTLIFWILTCLPLSWRIGTLFALVFGMFYLQYSGINYGYFSQIHYALRYCYGRIAELLPYAATGILLGLVMARKTKSWILMLATAGIGGLYAATQPYAHPQGIDYSGIRFYFGGVFIFMYFATFYFWEFIWEYTSFFYWLVQGYFFTI